MERQSVQAEALQDVSKFTEMLYWTERPYKTKTTTTRSSQEEDKTNNETVHAYGCS
jgi:hypothetical protein